jgi:hypothetical protein
MAACTAAEIAILVHSGAADMGAEAVVEAAGIRGTEEAAGEEGNIPSFFFFINAL